MSRDHSVTVALLPSATRSRTRSAHSPFAGMPRNLPTKKRSSGLKVPREGLTETKCTMRGSNGTLSVKVPGTKASIRRRFGGVSSTGCVWFCYPRLRSSRLQPTREPLLRSILREELRWWLTSPRHSIATRHPLRNLKTTH